MNGNDPAVELIGQRLMSGQSGIPTFDELAAAQNFKRQQRGIPADDLSGKSFDPFNPLEQYDFISALRGNWETGIDPSDKMLHGDSRFKSPTHPTRFGTDTNTGITDRITGGAVDLSNPVMLDLVLKALTGEK